MAMLPLIHATATQTGAAHLHNGAGNEDRAVAVVDAFPGPAFAVLDGHGGAAAAAYLAKPIRLIGVVGAELRRTIGDHLVDSMTRVCHDFQQDQVRHTQLLTEVEQQESRHTELEQDDDFPQTQEIASLKQRVRDLHAAVEQLKGQMAARASFMRAFWTLVDEAFADSIVRVFRAVDAALLKAIVPQLDGSTCVAVWLVGRHINAEDVKDDDEDQGITLYCANVGDSRAVLCRGGRAVALSQEQRPDDPRERARIEREGGVVQTLRGSRVPRVYSPAAAQLLPTGTPIKCLAMARSFGDRPLKQPVGCVTCEPDVRAERLGADDVLLVLASDGVWDALSSQDAVDLALAHFGDADRAARAIVDAAQQRGSKDDATATVVHFSWQRERVREMQRAMKLKKTHEAATSASGP